MQPRSGRHRRGKRQDYLWTALAGQRLRLHTSNAGGTGLIPAWGTKISHAALPGQKNLKKKKKERKKEKILKSSIGFRPRYLDCHTSAVWLNLYQTLMIFVFTHHFISNAKYTLCLKTLRVKKWVNKMDLSPTFAREVKKSQHTSHEKMWRIWKFDFGFISEQRETNHQTF